MSTKWGKTAAVVTGLLVFHGTLLAQAPTGGDYELRVSTVDGGGSRSQGGAFEVRGSLGQSDAGSHAASSLETNDGFWYSTLSEEPVEDRPDLAVASSGIGFSPWNPAALQLVTIQASVRNVGLADASDIEIHFLDFETLLDSTTIALLEPGAEVQVSIEASFPDEGFRLIQVVADPDGSILELRERNNDASAILQVGAAAEGEGVTLVVEASAATTCQGNTTFVVGRADYDFEAIVGDADYPVQGGLVTVDSTSPELVPISSGGHTLTSGSYRQALVAPDTDGVYTIEVTITDGSLTGQVETTLTVSGACPTPPPFAGGSGGGSGGGGGGGGSADPGEPGPNVPPGQDPNDPPAGSRDVFVYSVHEHAPGEPVSDLGVSKSSPALGESVVVMALLHYFGADPALDVPVIFNDLFPLAGELEAVEIGRTTVSFQGEDGIATAPWVPTVTGAHILQVKAEPTFDQFTGNDAATRIVFVGQQTGHVDFTSEVVLIADVDEDGEITPGDTIEYTLSFENVGELDLTGVTIFAPIDGRVLETPHDVSDGGLFADGMLSWDHGGLPAGASGSVSYRVDLLPPLEFPVGETSIVGDALLSADQIATVGLTHDFLVELPPCIDDDGDGYGSPGAVSCPNGPVEDCDDDDAAIHPAAAEACNGLDDDCDGALPAAESDADLDGFLVCQGDCDDSNPSINPDALEDCNGIDDDCDGLVPASEADDDLDGYRVCEDDCDDAVATVHPGALEVCDGVDQDCDAIVDDGLATLTVRAAEHVVGAGTHPGSTKQPLVDLLVGVYDKSDGSCARDACGGISHQDYDCIFESCDPVETGNLPDPASASTDAAGEVVFHLPPGDYLVLGGDGTEKHLGVSASDLGCGDTVNKHLQLLVRDDGRRLPAKTTRRTGSELLIIEPEYIEWTDEQEEYPVVFEATGDWLAAASVEPPEGFESDYAELSAEVVDEIEAVQFTITDIGSDWVPTTLRYLVRHQGRRERIVGRIGVLLTAELAASKNLDRRGHPLDEDGEPILPEGHDPRDPFPCEIVGWIEASETDESWVIKVHVDVSSDLTLEIVRGSEYVVETLADGVHEPGDYEFTWTEDDAHGRYFAKLTSGEVEQREMLTEK